MGTWGIQTFENDRALDWLGDFRDEPSEEQLRQVFDPQPRPTRTGFLAKLLGPGPLRPPLNPYGEHVLAAAEVVAALRGQPAANAARNFENLPVLKISDEILAMAIKAVDSILNESELKEDWEDTDDYAVWAAAVEDIKARLAKS